MVPRLWGERRDHNASCCLSASSLAPPAEDQHEPGQQGNCRKAAPQYSSLLQIDVLRYGIVAAAEFIEAVAPAPVAGMERKRKKDAEARQRATKDPAQHSHV